MSEAKAAPQLLILAEPLLREGLIRLLEPSYRLADPATASSGVDLVIWSVDSSIPAANLQNELRQLRERWQPAPLLLLLPGDCSLPHNWLLQLPCDGLLQQAEPAEITAAVAQLLAGGRVLELRPLQAAAREPEVLGMGQWLLRSGLAQIQSEEQRCQLWLQQQIGRAHV